MLLQQKLAAEGTLNAENVRLTAEIARSGFARIAAERAAAFARAL